MPKKITKPQIQKIKIISRKVFPADDLYRAWLGESFGVESCTDLTFGQARRAVDLLDKLQSGRPVPTQDEPKYFGGGDKGAASHLTQAQADEIERLQRDMKWTDDRLVSFINRQIGRMKFVSGLTRPEATSVITGLRKSADYKRAA